MGGSELGVLRFGCPHCDARLKALERQAGGQLRCPECGEVVRVPNLGIDEFAEADEPAVDPWIVVECRVCHTRMDARRDQVGKQIACPDCNTLATVPPPPPPPKKVKLTAPTETIAVSAHTPAPREVPTGPTTQIVCPHCGHRQATPVERLGHKHSCAGCFLIFVPPTAPKPPSEHGEDDDDELQLSAPVAAPRPRHTLPDFDLEVDDGSPDPTGAPTVPFASRPELSRPLPPRAKLPDWPLVNGVFGFPFTNGVWQRWLGLSVGLAAVLILVANGVAVTQGGPSKEWALAILYSGLAVFGAAMWYVFGPAILLAIFQDTAAGNDRVESWPDGPWIDTALEGLYLVCALATAGLVASGVWEGAKLIGLDLRIAALLAGSVGFVAFPVFLLSMIEQGSILMPVSGPVWSSVISGWRWWALFLVESLLLGLVLEIALMGVVRSLRGAGIGIMQMLLLAAMAGLVVGFMIVYFRLLGRLAWCCEEVLSLRAADDDEEERPPVRERRPALDPLPAPVAPITPERPRYTGPSDDDDDFLSGI